MNLSKPITETDTTLGKSNNLIKGLKNNKNLSTWVIVTISYLLLILFYWAPFSWNTPPYHDLWDLMFQYDSYFHFSDFYKIIINFFQARPAIYVIYHFAPLISPNSFIGYNVILAAMLFLKSIFTFALVKKLVNENIQVAFLAGVLVAIWPTDHLWFELDFTAYHFGSLLIIVSIYLLITYWQKSRLYLLIMALYVLIWSLGTYEHGILTALSAPLILLILDKRISKRLIILTVVWFIPSLLKMVSFGYSLLTQSPERSYELKMLDINNPFSIVWETIKYCYVQNYYYWIERVSKRLFPERSGLVTPEIIQFSIFSAIVVGVVLIVLFFINRKRVNEDSAPTFIACVKQHGYILLFSLISIYVAYFLFVPTINRFRDVRTFIYSAVWITLFISLVFWIISLMLKKRFAQQFLFISLASLLTVTAVLSSLVARSTMISYTIRYFGDITPVFEHISAIKQDTVIVLIDNTSENSGFKSRQRDPQTLNRMIRYAYNDNSLFTVVCRKDDPETVCIFEDDRLLVPVMPVHLIPGAIAPIVIVDVNGEQMQAFTYDRIVMMSYKRLNKVEFLVEIPAEYASADLVNPVPETYEPYRNIRSNTEPGFSSAAQRLKTFFDYTYDYLIEKKVLTTQQVMDLYNN